MLAICFLSVTNAEQARLRAWALGPTGSSILAEMEKEIQESRTPVEIVLGLGLVYFFRGTDLEERVLGYLSTQNHHISQEALRRPLDLADLPLAFREILFQVPAWRSMLNLFQRMILPQHGVEPPKELVDFWQGQLVSHLSFGGECGELLVWAYEGPRYNSSSESDSDSE